MVKDLKEFPEGIEAIKSSYTILKTGDTREDHFFKTADDSDRSKAALKKIIRTVALPEGYTLFYQKINWRGSDCFRTMILKGKESLPGFLVESAEIQSSYRDKSYIALDFTPRGGTLFAEITGRLSGYRLGIVIDGVVNSAPIIQESIIGGYASITSGGGLVSETIKLQKAIQQATIAPYLKKIK